jgi:hypothetical protein
VGADLSVRSTSARGQLLAKLTHPLRTNQELGGLLRLRRKVHDRLCRFLRDQPALSAGGTDED